MKCQVLFSLKNDKKEIRFAVCYNLLSALRVRVTVCDNKVWLSRTTGNNSVVEDSRQTDLNLLMKEKLLMVKASSITGQDSHDRVNVKTPP